MLLLPLLALPACVDTRPRAELEIRYADLTGGAVLPQDVVVRFDDGAGAQRAVALLPPEGDVEPTRPAASFGTYETRTSGSIWVEAVVVRALDDTLASGVVYLPLRPDWRWTVEIFVASSGALLARCAACEGWRAFPVRDPWRPGAADTLYLAWGGTSLSGHLTR